MGRSRRLVLEDLVAHLGVSRAIAEALVAAQPATKSEALRVRGVGVKTMRRLQAAGLLEAPGARRSDALPARPAVRVGPGPRDDREEVRALFANLRAALPTLEDMLGRCRDDWRYEDPVYRFYHQSYKVYGLQEETVQIVEALRALAPAGRPLNAWFLRIVSDGTGKRFEAEHNARWLEVTRPIVEAFFHARFFLEMAVRYGHALEAPPQLLPSGWAALLYLYDLR